MGKIKLAIVGLGNCASALIQGIEYYKKYTSQDKFPGLMHFNLGGYLPGDIEVVAAFDIDERKVNKPLKEAVFAKPNCTRIFYSDLPDYPVKVSMGPVLDGFAEHMKNYSPDKRFIPAQEEPVDVVKVLKESDAQVMVSYLPVGSEEATCFYAQAALDSGVAFINCVPVFVASKDEWIKKI